MMRRLDKYWYRVLVALSWWTVLRARACARRAMARKAKAKPRGEAVHRFRQELARQNPHLN